MRARRPGRVTSAWELAQACALLVVLLAVFLWQPLTTRNGYYATTDILQTSPLLRVASPDYRPENPLLGDPVWQMHPWLEWNRTELRGGDLPVWNPYNGGGTPHLANLVSATFSPFSLPFYVVGFRLALMLAAGLKLFVLGIFTYLFLRRVRLSHLAGLVGAVAFTFSAYNILWLNWPHPGSAVVLPAGLYFAEVAIAASGRRRAWWAWAGYGGAVAVSILAGHPETLFFAWGTVLAYVALRVLLFPPAERSRRRAVQLGELAVASVLAVGLCAVQLVPFAEYLQRSTALAQGSTRSAAHYDIRFSVLHVFPDLFGNPARAYYEPGQMAGSLRLPDGVAAGSNYNESIGFYVGVLVLLLAALGVVGLLRRSRRSFPLGFLAASAGIWLVYAHDLGGVNRFLATLPLVELNTINRSHPVWLFAVSCLAAAGVDLVLSGEDRRQRTVAALLTATAGTGLAGVAFAAERLVRRRAVARPAGMAGSALAQTQVSHHLVFVGATLAVGVAALVALAMLGRGTADRSVATRAARAVAAMALLGVVFAQSGFLLRAYNPTVDRRLFYPRSPALATVQRLAGNDLVLAEGLLPADANLWYRQRIPASYDGLGIKNYEDLYRALASSGPSGRARMLSMLGIRWVVTTSADGAVAIFENPAALRRYFSPGRAQSVGSDSEALREITSPAFDPAGLVLLARASPRLARSYEGMGPPAAASGAGQGRVEVISEAPTRIRLRVQRDGPGWMVALQNWYPGWQATVNGRAATLERADVAFSAVAVPQGSSEVVLRYRPASVRWGVAVSAASLAMALALLGFALVGGRRRAPEDPDHELDQGVLARAALTTVVAPGKQRRPSCAIGLDGCQDLARRPSGADHHDRRPLGRQPAGQGGVLGGHDGHPAGEPSHRVDSRPAGAPGMLSG